MSLVQDDHVIEAFAADTPNQPFDVRILPRTSGGNQHVFDPHVPHPLPKKGACNFQNYLAQFRNYLSPTSGGDGLIGHQFSDFQPHKRRDTVGELSKTPWNL